MSLNNQITAFVAPGTFEAEIILAAMAVKSVDCKLIEVVDADQLNRVLEMTGEASLPIVVDREVSLSRLHIILEYMEERFPSPSLLPLTPAARANCRMSIDRMERELNPSIDRVAAGDHSELASIIRTLDALGSLFSHKRFFCSEEISTADIVLLVLLNRAIGAGIQLTVNRHLAAYYNRVVALPCFINLRRASKAA